MTKLHGRTSKPQGFWELTSPLIVDGGCVAHIACIRNTEPRIEAQESIHRVLGGM